MKEHILNYWIEAVDSALEDIGKQNILSNNDIKRLAESLIISSEQQSMAFGYEHIPNPLQSEIEKIKLEYETKIKRLEQNDFIYRKNVADRHKVDLKMYILMVKM